MLSVCARPQVSQLLLELPDDVLEHMFSSVEHACARDVLALLSVSRAVARHYAALRVRLSRALNASWLSLVRACALAPASVAQSDVLCRLACMADDGALRYTLPLPAWRAALACADRVLHTFGCWKCTLKDALLRFAGDASAAVAAVYADDTPRHRALGVLWWHSSHVYDAARAHLPGLVHSMLAHQRPSCGRHARSVLDCDDSANASAAGAGAPAQTARTYALCNTSDTVLCTCGCVAAQPTPEVQAACQRVATEAVQMTIASHDWDALDTLREAGVRLDGQHVLVRTAVETGCARAVRTLLLMGAPVSAGHVQVACTRMQDAEIAALLLERAPVVLGDASCVVALAQTCFAYSLPNMAAVVLAAAQRASSLLAPASWLAIAQTAFEQNEPRAVCVFAKCAATVLPAHEVLNAAVAASSPIAVAEVLAVLGASLTPCALRRSLRTALRQRAATAARPAAQSPGSPAHAPATTPPVAQVAPPAAVAGMRARTLRIAALLIDAGAVPTPKSIGALISDGDLDVLALLADSRAARTGNLPVGAAMVARARRAGHTAAAFVLERALHHPLPDDVAGKKRAMRALAVEE